jgi:hypothetical protein
VSYVKRPKPERIAVGDVISCPKCDRDMLRCIEQPVLGSKDYTKCFEDLGWGGDMGFVTICPTDGAAWCVTGPFFAVHVQGKGWISG